MSLQRSPEDAGNPARNGGFSHSSGLPSSGNQPRPPALGLASRAISGLAPRLPLGQHLVLINSCSARSTASTPALLDRHAGIHTIKTTCPRGHQLRCSAGTTWAARPWSTRQTRNGVNRIGQGRDCQHLTPPAAHIHTLAPRPAGTAYRRATSICPASVCPCLAMTASGTGSRTTPNTGRTRIQVARRLSASQSQDWRHSIPRWLALIIRLVGPSPERTHQLSASLNLSQRLYNWTNDIIHCSQRPLNGTTRGRAWKLRSKMQPRPSRFQ